MHNIVKLDDDNFAEEVFTTKNPILIEFTADWCDNCKEFNDTLKQLVKLYKDRIKFAKVDIDQSFELANRFQITKLPSFIIYHKSKPINFFIGNISIYKFKEAFEEIL